MPQNKKTNKFIDTLLSNICIRQFSWYFSIKLRYLSERTLRFFSLQSNRNVNHLNKNFPINAMQPSSSSIPKC